MLKQKKLIVIVCIIVGIVVATLISLFSAFTNGKPIELSGILEADQVEIPSLVSGVVKDIDVKEGDKVDKFQTILTIDSSQLEIKKEEAMALVAQAEAQHDLMKTSAAGGEVKQLQSKVNQAQSNLQNVTSGPRKEEIQKLEARIKSLKTAFETAKNEFDSAKRLYENDIISKSKLDSIEAVFATSESMLIEAQETLKILNKGAKPSQINIAKQQVIQSKAMLSQAVESKPSRLKATEAQVQQAESNLKLIQKMISDSNVKSRVAGTVSQVFYNAGELVTKGSTIASVINLDNLWVKVFVPESKLVFLRSGQAAYVYPDAVSKTIFEGRISYISEKGAFVPPGTKESADQQVFEVKVTLDKSVKDNLRLRPGMSVKVKIDTSQTVN